MADPDDRPHLNATEDKEPIHINTDRARGGSTPGVTRYVLGVSLVLIIVLFAFIVLHGVHSG